MLNIHKKQNIKRDKRESIGLKYLNDSKAFYLPFISLVWYGWYL